MAVVTNYTTLQSLIERYLARSDLTADVPQFVQMWEERFYRDSANWASWMETALSVSITSNVAALPNDYLGLKVAYISGQSAPLQRVTLAQLYARYPRGGGTSGQAAYIARDGSNFRFGPEAVSGTLEGTYYAKPTTLRADGDGVNWLITNAPDLCLYGALLEAQPFLKDSTWIDTWQRYYNEALMAYRSQFKEEEYLAPFTVAV